MTTESLPLAPPLLPAAQGPVSGAVLETLGQRPPRHHLARIPVSLADCDPYGLDLQLALFICYELHYRGFSCVDGRWEWNPGLLHLRASLEDTFVAALQHDVGEVHADADALAEMEALSVEPVDGVGPSHYLRQEGSWEQMREYFVHRSLYHLKEGDPHVWAVPRLSGRAKAAFVAVEFDEYGGGRPEMVHQQLFADLLDAAGLDSGYLAYLGIVPAQALTVVNLMSMFGLHRSWRGAAVGHFAATEITSPPGARRLVDALQRMTAPEACIRFYAEHVEADAVHEQVVRADVVGDLVAREPHLENDVVFGIRAREVVEEQLATYMMTCWTSGVSSLRRPPDRLGV